MGKGYESEKFTQVQSTFSVTAGVSPGDEEHEEGIKALALTCLFAVFLCPAFTTWRPGRFICLVF